jgi:hypothetical protein
MKNSIYSISVYQITLEIISKKEIDWPNWKSNTSYTIENQLESDCIKTQIVNFNIDYNQQELILEIFNQNNFDENQFVKIQKIWANNIKLDFFTVCKLISFMPVYTTKDRILAKQKQVILDDIIETADGKIMFNGNWQFKFEQPFFNWYNNLLHTHATNLSIDKKSDLFGYISDEKINRVKYIINQLN